MLFLIEKDSATRIPKDCSLEEAKAMSERFPVHVVKEDGSTQPLPDYLAEQEPVTGEQLVTNEPVAGEDRGGEQPAA